NDLLLDARLLCTDGARVKGLFGLANEFSVLVLLERLCGLDEQRNSIEAENEPHPIGIPAIEVDRLRKCGIASQQDVLPSCAAAECDRAVEVLGCTFLRWSVTASVHDEQRLSRVRQRNEQRVVTPDAVVRDAHTLLTLPGCLDDRPVGVDACDLFEE